MPTYAIWIVAVVLLGLVCVFIVKKRGKGPAAWFGVGALLGIFVLLVATEIKKRRRSS